MRRYIVMGAVLATAWLGGATGDASAQEQVGNLLQPGDEIMLRIWPDTALSGRFRIESNGQVYVPIVGFVQALGRTPEDLRDELLERYSDVISSPVVLVTPRFRVALLGAVRGPGLHWVEPSTTLFELIVQTGGLAENARPDKILLQRRGQVFSVDIEDALEENAPTAAVPLNSGDRILVPEGRSWRSFFQGLQLVLQATTLTFTILNWVNR